MYLSEPKFIVKAANETFDYWLNQEFISASARKQLDLANMLVTPQIGHPAHDGPIFSEWARDFMSYCYESNIEGLRAELCIGEADYFTLSLRSFDLFLPDVIVERIIIPIYVKVMSGYISEKIRARFGSDIRVNAKVTVVDRDRNIATEFSYRGKPADYENTVAKTLTLIASAADLKLAGESEDLSDDERIERLSGNSQ